MAEPFTDTDVVRKTYFIDESERSVDPADDAGKVVQLEADGKISAAFFERVGARVYKATNIGAGGSETIFNFDTENFDTHGFHSNVTNPSRLTVPSGKSGLYSIGCSIEGNANSLVYIKLNGTTKIAANGGGDTDANSISTIYELSDGDYIEVAITSGGINIIGGEQTNFWLRRLSK